MNHQKYEKSFSRLPILRQIKNLLKTVERWVENQGYRSPFRSDPPLDNTVSLIVPTYNVELYLDAFLASVTSQSTGLSNVEVIIIDDGSTDQTGIIAQSWVKRFPNTIKYHYQDNRGAAEARNTGLRYASGEWINFPDPDDILPRNWLNAFSRETKKSHRQKLLMVILPRVFFFEATGRIANTHPLRNLHNKRREYNTSDLDDLIAMSTAVSWFRRQDIEQHGLRFDSRVRPSFEDGHFVNRLLLASPNRSVVVLKRPAYIYRKRAAKTSQLDGTNMNPRWYTDQLRFGYLDLLVRAKNSLGSVPTFLQRTILYDIYWRLRFLVDHPERSAMIPHDVSIEFLSLLHAIFAYLDPNVIRQANVAGLSEEHKVALLHIFKGEDRANSRLYVSGHDPRDNAIQFAAYTGGDTPHAARVFANGAPLEQMHASRRTVFFLDQPYFTEHRFWVRADEEAQLSAEIAGHPAQFRRSAHRIGFRTNTNALIGYLTPPTSSNHSDEATKLRNYATSEEAKNRFKDCLLLMDRAADADDNAEHLYRYMRSIGKADRVYFVLQPDSPDWDRLQADEFPLLPYGGKEHIAALVNASIFASSHIDNSVLWPVPRHWLSDIIRYRFVFIQHGVIHSDLSKWLNTKPIELFITSTLAEYQSISAQSSNYLFSERQVRLTGMPRHDALLQQNMSEDIILIMPTWRRYLADDAARSGITPELIDHFLASDYVQHWRDLLLKPELKVLAETHGKRIVFCPHPNMAIYLDHFDLPGHIELRDPRQPPSLQTIFAQAALLVTDYSSVAFDCAYINKPIVYFQFDRNEAFSGGHMSREGYFDYREHGFGPVVETHDETLDAISNALHKRTATIYAQRAQSTFAWRDGRCSERVYEAIADLKDKPITRPLQVEELRITHSGRV